MLAVSSFITFIRSSSVPLHYVRPLRDRTPFRYTTSSLLHFIHFTHLRTARKSNSFILSLFADPSVHSAGFFADPFALTIQANKRSFIHPFKFVQSFSHYTCLSLHTLYQLTLYLEKSIGRIV